MPASTSDVIRAAARHTFAGAGDVVNVLHFVVSTVPGVLDDDVMAIDLSRLLSTTYQNIAGQMTTSVIANDIHVYNVTDDYPVGYYPWTPPYVGGTSVAEGLPPGDAALVLARTSVKRKVGKIYLPPFIEGSQNNGGLNPAAEAAIDSFTADIQDQAAQVGGYGFTYVVYGRSTAVASVPTSMGGTTNIAYQRRRRAGSGS